MCGARFMHALGDLLDHSLRVRGDRHAVSSPSVGGPGRSRTSKPGWRSGQRARPLVCSDRSGQSRQRTQRSS